MMSLMQWPTPLQLCAAGPQRCGPKRNGPEDVGILSGGRGAERSSVFPEFPNAAGAEGRALVIA